jgi:hypothetical protein
MSEEMVAALKVGATGKVAREEWLVKSKTLQAYATLQLSLCSLAEWGSQHSIEVIKDGTIWVKKDVYVLVTAPGDFSSSTEVLLVKKKIAAERRISTSTDALWRVVPTGQGVCGRLPSHGTDAKCDVKLLSECCAPAQQKHRKGRAH